MIAQAKAEGEQQAAQLLQQARESAEALTARRLAEAEAQSSQLADLASARVDHAAALIVERIVETK